MSKTSTNKASSHFDCKEFTGRDACATDLLTGRDACATDSLTGRDACATFISFNSYLDTEVTQRNLPHWQQPGTTYFITFRIADSIPKEKILQWKNERENWLKTHPSPLSDEDRFEYYEKFPKRLNEWLDKGAGSCVLKNEKVSEIVENALKYFDGKKYELGEWVIMPNHVHMLITPIGGFTLDKVMHSIKSFTAQKINEYLSKKGIVWQNESYDHIVRNLDQKYILERYIINNPKAAELKKGFRCSKSKFTNEP